MGFLVTHSILEVCIHLCTAAFNIRLNFAHTFYLCLNSSTSWSFPITFWNLTPHHRDKPGLHLQAFFFWNKMILHNNYFNIACTVHSVATISLYRQPYMHCNIYTTDAQNLLLPVATLCGCHRLGVFTVVIKQRFWNCLQYVPQSHNCMCINTAIKPPIKCWNVKTTTETFLQAPGRLWSGVLLSSLDDQQSDQIRVVSRYCCVCIHSVLSRLLCNTECMHSLLGAWRNISAIVSTL
jgi:hypothetical protein